MGSRREETALAKYMPESFRRASPVCKTPWTVNTAGEKVQLECHPCGRDLIVKALPSKWWAVSGSYVPSYDWAIESLWSQFVFTFGLAKAISMCSD
jgi:hypothetical protein